MTRPHVCPYCQCERRRKARRKPISDPENIARAQKLIRELAVRYGSIHAAGQAYGERYGIAPKSGERYFNRVLQGKFPVSYWGLDRIEVFAAS